MLADLTLVLSILSQVLPFLGGALLVIAIVPMAAIAARNRLRAVVVGAIAASTVGFLVLGTPVVTNVIALRRPGCGRRAARRAAAGVSARTDRRRGAVPVAAGRPDRRRVALAVLGEPKAGSRPDPQQLARVASTRSSG